MAIIDDIGIARERITVDNVHHLAAGAALLGSGGGGDPSTTEAMLRHRLTHHDPVPLHPLATVPGDARVLCVGAVGSMSVLDERTAHGDEFTHAINAVADHLTGTVDGVMPIGIGGTNAVMAVLIASRSGLLLLDADAMGRAFPRMTQTTLSAAGIPAAPTAVAVSSTSAREHTAPDHTIALIPTATDHMVDQLVRGMLPALGGWCALATYPARARDYAEAAIDGAFSTTLRLGAGINAARSHGEDARWTFLRDNDATLLGGGTVVDIRRNDTSAGPRAVVTVQHREEPDRTLRLDCADEYFLVLEDGLMVAVTPQPICVLDRRTWEPISVSRVGLHQQIDIVSFPAPHAWKHEDSLVGLSSYGLDDIPGPVR